MLSLFHGNGLLTAWQIRGAPAIASLAALSLSSYISSALVQIPRPEFLSSPETFKSHIQPLLDYLFTARPTAVNLGAAIRRIEGVLKVGISANKNVEDLAQDVVEEGRRINDEDIGRNHSMAKHGGEWLVEQVKRKGGSGEGLNVMTVCNTGSLATSVSHEAACLCKTSQPALKGYGTALGLITYLHETGKLNKAYFTQSTPYHQGSR